MTPEETTQWVNDAKRRSFENGWKAAIKKFEEWLNIRMVSKNTIEEFRQFMEE